MYYIYTNKEIVQLSVVRSERSLPYTGNHRIAAKQEQNRGDFDPKLPHVPQKNMHKET